VIARRGEHRRWQHRRPPRGIHNPARAPASRGGPIHGKNLGRVGSLERDHATSDLGNTLWCTGPEVSRENCRFGKRASGWGSDGCAPRSAGKALGRMKTRRAQASATTPTRWAEVLLSEGIEALKSAHVALARRHEPRAVYVRSASLLACARRGRKRQEGMPAFERTPRSSEGAKPCRENPKSGSGREAREV
jgi:hypothetical protein